MSNYALQTYLFAVGSKHPAVKTVKNFLISHPRVRTFGLSVNDNFDSQTQSALAEYQRYKGMAASGVMTSETYRAMGADMLGAQVEIAVVHEPALRLLFMKNDFGMNNVSGDGDGATTLPSCAKNAILEYYKSVGNSSAARLSLVERTLNNVIISFTDFPASTPPGIARRAQAATDAVGGAGTYEGITGQDPMRIQGYTASSTRVYYDSGVGGLAMLRTVAGMSLMTHEFTHVMQYLEEPNFSVNYVREMLKHGSHEGGGNRFEERAYTNGKNSANFYSNNQNLLCNTDYSN